MLYTDEEDNEKALELAKQTLSGEIYQNGPANSFTISAQFIQKKTAENVAMRLKVTENKFSGNLGQFWQNFRDSCDQVAEDNALSDTQRLQFFLQLVAQRRSALLSGKFKHTATPYQEAAQHLKKEYNSVERQTRAKNYLGLLRLEEFKSAITDTAAALAIVYKRILSFSRQVPVLHRGDAHRIESLRAAITG